MPHAMHQHGLGSVREKHDNLLFLNDNFSYAASAPQSLRVPHGQTHVWRGYTGTAIDRIEMAIYQHWLETENLEKLFATDFTDEHRLTSDNENRRRRFR
jgi:hypothetical protein